ncbi:MAG TPA: endonuclease V [Kofleriaceae bacterium]|nr:endonuclease V [Kofleriaceae bacterium]
MFVCLDVDYQPALVTTGCVGFEAWTDELAAIELVVRSRTAAAAYQPGAFFERELPYLLAALDRMPSPIDAIVIDGYVVLDGGRPGLGAHLHDRRREPVIGVAKTRFEGAPALEVTRGDSAKPLYITAIGIDAQHAAEHVRAMHGEFRIPTLIKRADSLARGH